MRQSQPQFRRKGMNMVKSVKTRIGFLLLALLMALGLFTGCDTYLEEASGFLESGGMPQETGESAQQESAPLLERGGSYSSKEDVSLYLHLYGELPEHYLTKAEARALGWDSSKGTLWEVAPGKSIGGDRFYNNEELLPTAQERKYFECDVNYQGGFRGAERIIYSDDGLIYYTEDPYKSFTQLYGGDEP